MSSQPRNKQIAGRCPADGQVNADQDWRTQGNRGKDYGQDQQNPRDSTARPGRAAGPLALDGSTSLMPPA
ncbi:hypothetical protein [Arthrobacter sp. Bi26]|uniref:hypothetical protein n=1 Tax=Arthrobacter sp. Bi26 TaxID=2822350 RepID=UPI001E5DC803|nr:hypothetical protein [Arthrobacter sp. Bi26]